MLIDAVNWLLSWSQARKKYATAFSAYFAVESVEYLVDSALLSFAIEHNNILTPNSNEIRQKSKSKVNLIKSIFFLNRE